MSRARVDYVEIPVTDIERARTFYGKAFGWTFQAWGDAYVSFNDGREAGGFQLVDEVRPGEGPLLILRTEDPLETLRARIEPAGGSLKGEIMQFPGGRRFHFHDPDGHELAVWTEEGGLPV